jgi:hypothetical protein
MAVVKKINERAITMYYLSIFKVTLGLKIIMFKIAFYE